MNCYALQRQTARASAMLVLETGEKLEYSHQKPTTPEWLIAVD